MKKLIVNADDFGLHQAINDGIIKGHKDGFITSTSLMCGADAFDDAVSQAKQYPNLGVGIHLTLVGGGNRLYRRGSCVRLLMKADVYLLNYTVFAKQLVCQ